MDNARLERLKANVRIGGKGTPRRKLKRNVTAEADDTKVQAALHKMNAVTMTGVTSVTMLTDKDTVISFGRPAVQHAPAYSTLAIHGHSVEKPSSSMIPDMFKNMTPEQLEQFKAISAQLEKANAEAAPAAEGEADAEIPKLVEGETFDQVD